MNYRKIYFQLIERAKTHSNLSGYTEIHHVIPKSLGGTDLKSNLVKLTAREHFIAHWLLTKVYDRSKLLQYMQQLLDYDIGEYNLGMSKKYGLRTTETGNTITKTAQQYVS